MSRGRRYIFVHVPKTGGTSLAMALEARAMADDILIGDTPKGRARAGRVKGLTAAGRLWKHSTLADIAGVVSDEEVAAFFTVTLVRNPWDRVVSLYHWLRGQAFAHPLVGIAKSSGFAAFVGHPQVRASLRAWPYAAYMRDRHGVERASAFVRLERFAEDAAPFEAHLGFPLALPRVNESHRARDWRVYYDDVTAALLAQACAEDIARFGYGFDDPV